jgi:hypothetical protein
MQNILKGDWIRLSLVGVALAFYSAPGAGLRAEEIPVELVLGNRMIVDADRETVGLVRECAVPGGLHLSADFMFGGTWVQHAVRVEPIEAALKKITINVRGGGASAYVGVRDRTKTSFFYLLTPLAGMTEEPRTYVFDEQSVSLTKKGFDSIQYPITAVVLVLKRSDAEKAELEVRSVQLEVVD